MNDVKITVGNELYTTEFVIQDIRSMDSQGYDEATDEEKKAWVVSEFKEIINEEIDRLFKEDK